MKHIKFLFLILSCSNYAHAMELQNNLASLEISLTLLQDQLPEEIVIPELDILKGAIDELFKQVEPQNPVTYFDNNLKTLSTNINNAAQTQNEKEAINLILKKDADDLIKRLNEVDTNKENRNQISTTSRLIVPVFIKTLEEISNINFNEDIQEIQKARIAMFKKYVDNENWKKIVIELSTPKKIKEALGDIRHYRNISKNINALADSYEILEKKIEAVIENYLENLNNLVNTYENRLNPGLKNYTTPKDSYFPYRAFSIFQQEKIKLDKEKFPEKQAFEQTFESKDELYNKIMYNNMHDKFSNANFLKPFYALLLKNNPLSEENLTLKKYMVDHAETLEVITRPINKNFDEIFENIFDTSIKLKQNINNITINNNDNFHIVNNIPQSILDLFKKLKEDLIKLPTTITLTPEKKQSKWLLTNLLKIQYGKELNLERLRNISNIIQLSFSPEDMQNLYSLPLNIFDFFDINNLSLKPLQMRKKIGLAHEDKFSGIQLENENLFIKIKEELKKITASILNQIESIQKIKNNMPAEVFNYMITNYYQNVIKQEDEKLKDKLEIHEERLETLETERRELMKQIENTIQAIDAIKFDW